MATLLQCVKEFIDNITVTDRQEENIKASVGALSDYLKHKDSPLYVKDIFTSGSYERDTNLKPVDDIDVFLVLDKDKYMEGANLPSPQSILSKIKNWLDKNGDYEGKTSQDRPCITIQLSDKRFEIIPSFKDGFMTSYWIPKRDLSGWDLTDPIRHTESLNDIDKRRNYMIRPIIKAVKKWKLDAKLNLPSYHIEEVVINMFSSIDITNIRDGIEKWFKYGYPYLNSSKFKSTEEYQKVVEKIKKVDKAFDEALKKNDTEAITTWKDIFGRDFPVTTKEEDEKMAKALKEGSLKMASTGILGTTGKSVPANKGFFGDK